MRSKQLRSAFEKLDRRGLRLDRDDLLVLLACTQRERWEDFLEAVRSFVSLKRLLPGRPPSIAVELEARHSKWLRMS